MSELAKLKKSPTVMLTLALASILALAQVEETLRRHIADGMLVEHGVPTVNTANMTADALKKLNPLLAQATQQVPQIGTIDVSTQLFPSNAKFTGGAASTDSKVDASSPAAASATPAVDPFNQLKSALHIDAETSQGIILNGRYYKAGESMMEYAFTAANGKKVTPVYRGLAKNGAIIDDPSTGRRIVLPTN